MTWDINKPHKRGTDSGERRGDYLQADEYEATISSTDVRDSKNGNPMLVLTWTIKRGEATGTKHKGKKINDRIVLIQSVKWKFNNLLEALEIDEMTPGDSDEAERILVGRTCRIIVARSSTGYMDVVAPCYEAIKGRKEKQEDERPPDKEPESSEVQDCGNDDDIPF
jgi:hypothetical protein